MRDGSIRVDGTPGSQLCGTSDETPDIRLAMLRFALRMYGAAAGMNREAPATMIREEVRQEVKIKARSVEGVSEIADWIDGECLCLSL